MLFQETTALIKIANLNERIRIIQGGTSASKTVSTMLMFIDIAQQYPNLIISVVSHTLPHLRKGALRDFLNIMKGHNYYDDKSFNKANLIYTFPNGTIIEFFSVDEDSARGPRRDILFINEGNLISYETYNQLEVRTNMMVIVDFNPVNEFWVHTEVIPLVKHDFLKLTYKDNEALPQAIIDSIESRKNNENWWRVYGLGEIGVLEGSVYSDWKTIKKIPEEARLVCAGLDFGYTNDPTSIVAIYEWNNSYILDEICYQKGMSNRQIYKRLEQEGLLDCIIIADSAEPKSIDEISGYGANITGAQKGKDSISNGIQIIQDQNIYYTARSLNIEKEYRNYMWKTDKSGKSLNVPIDDFNHAMDAIRYGISFKKNYKPLDYSWEVH